MFSEENLIKARVTKMVSEDDLTSAASLRCLSLYFFTGLHLPRLSSPALPRFPSSLCLCCWLNCLNINEAVSPMYYKHK